MKQKPRLAYSTMTNRVYIVTKYRSDGNGNIVSDEKHDATDEFMAIKDVMLNHLQERPA